MKRKISITFLVALIITMMTVCSLASDLILSAKPILISPKPSTLNDTIMVQLDGEFVDFTDENGNVVNPKIINNRTMVPMRKIFEIFNAEIMWNNETRTVVATTAEKEITLTINSDKAKLKNLETNEEKEIKLDSAPVLLDNRTMVPVRFIAESLEKEVGWDSSNRTVIIIDFDKVAETLKEKAPVLEEIFKLEVEPLESFKSTSKVEGKIIYKDAENKANNETVNVEGNLELNLSKEKELEMYMDLDFSGKGTIYESLKESGMKELEVGIVAADKKAYAMMKKDGKEAWVDMGSELDMSSLESLQLTNTPKSYEEFAATLKENIGELNTASYEMIYQAVNMIAGMYSKEKITITGSGSNKTVKYEIDLMELIGQMLPQDSEELNGIEMKILATEKISNKKITTANVSLELAYEEPETEESFGLEFELDMKYNSINSDFEVTLPDVEIIK